MIRSSILALLVVQSVSAGAQLGQEPEHVGPKAPPPKTVDLTVPTAVILPVTSLSADLPSEPLTAEEAARIALKLQPSVNAAQGGVTSARGRTNQVQSGLLPQLVLSAGYNQLSSLSGGGIASRQSPTTSLLSGVSSVDRYAGGILLRQLLFDFNQTRNLVRQSQALEGVAKASLSQTQQNVVFAVKTAFYNYTSAQHLLHVNELNVENRQRQLDLARSRFNSGIGLPSDLANAQTAKSSAIVALTVARDNAEQTKVSLLLQMGVDTLTPIIVADEAEPVLPSDEPRALVNRALGARPEVRSAEQALRASRFGLSAARALNAPVVYAGVSAGSRGQDFPLNDSTLSLSLGMQFSLFDGGQRAGAIQQSKGQITTAEANLKSAVQVVQADVTSAYLSKNSAEQRVSIADNEVLNAQEALRIAEGRYRAGLGLFLDITNAQAQLLLAQTDQTQAQSAVNLARARLRYAVGEYTTFK